MNSRPIFLHRPAAWLLGATLSTLAACTTGPAYQRPQVAAPAAFKEAPSADSSWFPAAPADTLDRGPWWQLFGDPGLDALASEVEVSNQNVAAAVAAYAQAQALVRERRAALFPSLALDASATRAGGAGAPGTANSLRLDLGASWEPDIWGQLRLAVTSARASAEASAANLAAARLSAQAALATDYFALREADNEIALLTRAVAAYERSLRITQNQYDVGIAQRTDVLQAETQLDTARANLRSTVGQRAVLEHAIALLVGKAPAGFSVPVAPWNARVPAVPLTVPSGLLQRRPDIAAAERAVAAANAQIGIQRSAYFPSLNLSASYGGAGTNLLALFRASNTLWSLGLTAAQTLFDAGAIAARVEGAVAARDAAVANYRQVVLSGFQAVEDQLATSHALALQEDQRRAASAAADRTEQLTLNQYEQGLVPYTSVVLAQVTALSARQSLSQLMSSRQAAAVALIQALGGGWRAPGTS
ncbi:MAG: efflux transporter outer membrane subunit [Betaproteobacteria bacterium]|nr:efflux transporter outer membrane subunit [Betaproteobacteria bacterium]MDE2358256.1 efflux transporter outer membrane subunit [Betaproteobacteria bacterium]